MPAQLRLSLECAPDHAQEGFVVSSSNAIAARTLQAWPDWRGGALALVGPPGCGKSHLASIWAERVGAGRLADDPREALHTNRPLLVDDADSRLGDETLFHLLNLADRPGGGLLLTSRLPPSQWPAKLPDLRSRLNALHVAELAEPDDTALAAMLDKFFRLRSIRPTDELLGFLVRRIERSAVSASEVVARLDEAACAHGRPISRSLARVVLGEDASTPSACA